MKSLKDSVGVLDLHQKLINNFQSEVDKWVTHCFGPEIRDSVSHRNQRYLEESLELVQSCGMSKEHVLQMVEYVFSRDKGQISQEVGGVMTTLASLCTTHSVDMIQAGTEGLTNAWLNIDNIKEKQKNKPVLKSTYIIKICKRDGSTPMGECPTVEVLAENYHLAQLSAITINPGYETVSWGLKSEIEGTVEIVENSMYLDLIVSKHNFNKITEYLISHSDQYVKYLLGNDKEIEYVSKQLSIDISKYTFDYIKVIWR